MSNQYYFPVKSVIITSLLLIAGSFALQAQNLDVPYVPTPHAVVDQMLDAADVGPGDYVIDLGSGDGRIVIAAAKRGAAGHGVDLDEQRIREANANAREQNVTDRVVFVHGDLFETDFSQASVITMYLLSSVNRQLRPHLLSELRPGTRVVSHSFDMGDWEPDKALAVNSNSGTRDVYLWIIPADAKGGWNWKIGGESYSLSIQQQYQKIKAELTSGSTGWKIGNAILRGERISFSARNGNRLLVFSGHISGNNITGTVQIHLGDNQRLETWSATKQ